MIRQYERVKGMTTIRMVIFRFIPEKFFDII